MDGFKKLVWMLLILLGLNDGIDELLLFVCDGDDELLLLLDLLLFLLFGFDGEDLKILCIFLIYFEKVDVIKYF